MNEHRTATESWQQMIDPAELASIPTHGEILTPGNAIPGMAGATSLALVGIAVYCLDSWGSVNLSFLLLRYVVIVTRCLASQVALKVLSHRGVPSIDWICVGPLIVGRRPFRFQIRYRVPRRYAVGYIGFGASGDARSANQLPQPLKAVRTAVGLAGIQFFACSYLAIRSGLPVVPAVVVTCIGVAALQLTFSLLKVKLTGQPVDPRLQARQKAIRACAKAELAGRLDGLPDDVIRMLIQVRDNSASELIGHLASYRARTLQGEPLLAARHIRRAAEIADVVRRKPTIMPPHSLASVYHEAAFVAAAYANDLDYAARALAIGGAPYLDRLPYAKAMTALSIRRADRTEARN